MSQTVEIIREIKAPNNRIVVNIYVDGAPQTVTSVGAADQWVKTRLGIDSNGFMTAFVVRQKELDQLVNAKPAERKAIIERLAGIDTINMALKAAREEENSSKKTVATLGGSEDESTRTAEALDLSTRRLDKLVGEKDDYGLKISTLDTKLSNLRKKAEAIKDDEKQIQTLTTRIEMYEPQIKDAKEQLALLPQPIEESLTLDELRELLKETQGRLEAETEAMNSANLKLSSFRSEKERIEKVVASIESQMKQITPKPDLTADYEQALATLNANIETLRDQITTSKTKIGEYTESLESLNHADNCPTCQQTLANPKAIIEGIQSLIDSNNALAEKAEKDLNQARFDLGDTNSKLSAQTAYKKLVEDSETAAEQLKALGAETELQAAFDASKALVAALTGEKDNVIERGQLLKSYLATVDSRNTLVDKLTTLEKNFSDTTTALDDLTAKVGGAEVLKELANVNRMESELTQLRIEMGEVTNQVIALESRVGQEKQAARNAKEAWEKKQELMKKLETSSLTTDIIDKFRAETIASLAPELSEFATSLISEMTNGDFVEIRLDDEFNPSVVDSSGNERPVSWLSGGEESAVALALRIAIAFLITGGQPELLWLDEVLTAQDADRRSTMLSMIRRLPINQIIMINHTQEAGDIVDKSVEIVPNVIEGSSIKESLNNEDEKDAEDENSADNN
jgi:exonuclease SbcC